MGSLTLGTLLNLAAHTNPELASAQGRAEAARGRLIQAGLYPNPVFVPRWDEIGDRFNAGWGSPGATLTQEIVTAHKLKWAKAAAAAGVEAADWQAMTRFFDIRTRVRIAYYELLTAEREVEATRQLTRIADLALQAAQKLLAAGSGVRPDVIRARVDREQADLRHTVALRRLEAAGRLLATAVGAPDLPGLNTAGGDRPFLPVAASLEQPIPDWDYDALRQAVLARSSEVQEAQALVLQAERLLGQAHANAIPNLTVAVRPFYATFENDMRVLVEFGGPIPIFNRNQGNIRAAQADLARARADAHVVELRLIDRLTAAYQRYRTARRQVESYEKTILPEAREALRLVRLGYEKGDPKYDFTALLQAQQTVEQTQLLAVQARGDLWRAISEVAGLLQMDLGDEK
jgi:cobalt-zinc-cadmium efflux system outer membrane protein